MQRVLYTGLVIVAMGATWSTFAFAPSNASITAEPSILSLISPKGEEEYIDVTLHNSSWAAVRVVGAYEFCSLLGCFTVADPHQTIPAFGSRTIRILRTTKGGAGLSDKTYPLEFYLDSPHQSRVVVKIVQHPDDKPIANTALPASPAI